MGGRGTVSDKLKVGLTAATAAGGVNEAGGGASGGGVGEFENLGGAGAAQMLAESFNAIPTTRDMSVTISNINQNKSLSMSEKADRINAMYKDVTAKYKAHAELQDKIMAVNSSISMTSSRDRNTNFSIGDKLTQDSAIAFINKTVSGKLKVGEVGIRDAEKDGTTRAFHQAGNIHIIKGQQRHVIVHEIAHAVEQQNPTVLRNAVKFYKQRTRGQKAVTLNKLYKTEGYDKSEVSKPDKFVSKYMGKVYYKGTNRIQATELISMGLEKMSQSPTQLAIKDPHYFSMVYDSMRGRNWNSSVRPAQIKTRGIRKSKR